MGTWAPGTVQAAPWGGAGSDGGGPTGVAAVPLGKHFSSPQHLDVCGAVPVPEARRQVHTGASKRSTQWEQIGPGRAVGQCGEQGQAGLGPPQSRARPGMVDAFVSRQGAPSMRSLFCCLSKVVLVPLTPPCAPFLLMSKGRSRWEQGAAWGIHSGWGRAGRVQLKPAGQQRR